MKFECMTYSVGFNCAIVTLCVSSLIKKSRGENKNKKKKTSISDNSLLPCYRRLFTGFKFGLQFSGSIDIIVGRLIFCDQTPHSEGLGGAVEDCKASKDFTIRYSPGSPLFFLFFFFACKYKVTPL